MKQNSFEDIARIAAETWLWYTLKGNYGDVDYMQSLRKFQLVIGHDVSTHIPACPLLEKCDCKISDDIVTKGWKLYIVDFFV